MYIIQAETKVILLQSLVEQSSLSCKFNSSVTPKQLCLTQQVSESTKNA